MLHWFSLNPATSSAATKSSAASMTSFDQPVNRFITCCMDRAPAALWLLLTAPIGACCLPQRNEVVVCGEPMMVHPADNLADAVAHV
jgi:hypothetical protein